MQKQHLRMKYHPAKKEVEFTRYDTAGQPVVIRTDSELTKYMNEKGKFVLQDHGNSFFEDIAEAFDGEKTVHIEVVTTKNDYEDFEQMIEYYNEDPSASVKITANLLTELPDMEETYQVVCEHGKKSISILEKHQAKFFDVPLENESVKKCVEMFSSEVQTEANNIADKINSMTDNNVSLCFAGVFSSGKSALINAILGYRILPEEITSETARMFKIQSPKKGESIRIVFSIRHSYAELIWKNKTFEFGAAPTENNARKAIQETLNTYKEEPQHRQIYEALKKLNYTDEVDSDIKLFFPIPIDSDQVQFTIYDTPGTDSNYGEHQQILQKALSKQTHSILVFVIAPDRVEGEGNNALMTYLKEAEKKNGKTSIDIGRSLFVVNKADTVDPDARKVLQRQKITNKSDDSFSIKLSDKKLFFVSAMYAYSAKAVAKNIATKDETFRIEDDYNKIYRPERGRYYQQNRVATSECATESQIRRSNENLLAAEQKNDVTGIFITCSGLYALESEIITYGEKYASAVRAFAIIDSVDKALAAMNRTAKSLERQNQDNINEINLEIEEVGRTIINGIKDAYKNNEYPKDKPLPEDVLMDLHLDENYLYLEINGATLSFFEKLLKGWFFGLGKVKFNEKHKEEVTQKITSVISDFTREFLKKRQSLLEQLRDNFIADVKQTIRDNGDISDDAKAYVLDIRPPEIKRLTDLTELGEIYDSNKRIEKFLWIETPRIDKDGFIHDVDVVLTRITTSMAKEFVDDFHLTLTSILSAIEAEFAQNIDKYSLLMQAKLGDRQVMEQLRTKITEAAQDLRACQEELNKVIWSVKENGQ